MYLNCHADAFLTAARPLPKKDKTWLAAQDAVFSIDYVTAAALPSFDEYGRLLDSIARGDFFVSTGEVLLPEAKVSGDASSVTVNTRVRWTFPLRHAAIASGDGTKAHREVTPLTATGTFSEKSDQTRWDEQMDRDSASGKLDALFEEVETARAQNRLREWPPQQ
jgi:hypothetical protein